MVEEWNLVLFCSQVHSLLKANSQLKRMENRMENEKLWTNRNAQGISGHHGCGNHHGPLVEATTSRGVHHNLAVVGSSQPCSPASRTPHYGLRLGPRVLPWIIRIGPIGPIGPLLQASLIL